MGLFDGFLSLASNINKVNAEASETQEGVIGKLADELTLEKDDKELANLAKEWEERWKTSEAFKDLERKRNENERYWLGDHFTPAQKQSGNRDLVDNLIFESVETALPAWTRQIPEPVVGHDRTAEGQALAKKVTDRIVDIADTLRLRLKVRKATRHWSLYYLGALQYGWSEATNEIAIQVVRPHQLILDPDAVVDECEYDGEYLGKYRTDTARNLIARFPEKTNYITDKVNKKLGTRLRYIEWWTNDYLFWTLEGETLGKAKNPHWNYDTQGEPTTQTSVNDYGEEITTETPGETIPGLNHFANPKMPFGFLSVFNLGTKPFDNTNFIEQVIPLQDIVNKRQRQIDKNADSQNGGAVVSGDAFTKEQGAKVGDALRKGQTVWVPKGDVNRVYKRDQGAQLPEFVYKSLQDYRQEIRNIFGTTGLTSQGLQKTDTVRGKIMVKGADTDRATPTVDQLEELYDYTYNWLIQLMMVYYDSPRNVSRTQGTTTLINTEFTHPLTCSVKEGSIIPRDPLTQRNEAVELFKDGALDPIELYKRLDFANPYEAAKNLYLWKNNPIALFPDLQQAAAAAANPEPTPAEGEPPEIPKVEPNEGDVIDQVPLP